MQENPFHPLPMVKASECSSEIKEPITKGRWWFAVGTMVAFTVLLFCYNKMIVSGSQSHIAYAPLYQIYLAWIQGSVVISDQSLFLAAIEHFFLSVAGGALPTFARFCFLKLRRPKLPLNRKL